jgi:curved DNA-binding protein CbpA
MMKTPYEILEVKEDADDAGIKKAYLGMVRRYPPERCPDDFQRIYRAYEQVRTSEDRLSYRLFHCTLPEPADIAALLLQKDKQRVPASREEWQSLLARDLQQFCRELKL